MMPLSRRRFLGIAASAPLVLPQQLQGTRTTAPIDSVVPQCLLLDAGERCTLTESVNGFARGLAAASIRFERVPAQALTGTSDQGPKGVRPAQLLIIPGAVIDSTDLAKNIRRVTDAGGTALFESGVAFADRRAFETEQLLLRDYFGVSLEAPREMWPSKEEVGRTPYVRYHWPLEVMVRDFSRVVAVSSEAASSAHIAHMGTAAVACYRQLGKGAFIFLGSPLGPHVGFGDAEAQQLLGAFLLAFTRSEIQPPIRNLPISS
jgi:hypothetical protein